MNENTKNKILPVETVTRFIFKADYYSATIGRVKYPAFIPRNGETSVFRVMDFGSEKVWEIGKYVANESSRTLRARGDLAVSDIFKEKLKIVPETSKHILHANIVGWPSQKAEIKLHAMKLADKAILHMNPKS